MSRFLVISGLPASGKTTVGTAIAAELHLPLFDKDVILEAMFETIGIGDVAWRTKLSRSADFILQRLAKASSGGVLVSWWRNPRSATESGTPVEWLQALPGEVTEVYCKCEPSVAVDRFFARRRHPGHLDQMKSPPQELTRFSVASALGPIGVGRLIEVCTDSPMHLPDLLTRLKIST